MLCAESIWFDKETAAGKNVIIVDREAKNHPLNAKLSSLLDIVAFVQPCDNFFVFWFCFKNSRQRQLTIHVWHTRKRKNSHHTQWPHWNQTKPNQSSIKSSFKHRHSDKWKFNFRHTQFINIAPNKLPSGYSWKYYYYYVTQAQNEKKLFFVFDYHWIRDGEEDEKKLIESCETISILTQSFE